jgi:hypothetical protein
MKDSVLVKAIYTYIYIYCIYIYIYCIKENVLDRIITLETDLEGLGNLRCFFPMNPTP